MSNPQNTSNAASPVASATPQPARRLSRVALGIALLLGALLVTMGALVITSPPARSPLRAAGPKDQRPAEAAFLNNPPRHAPSSSVQREEERIANLLRLAREAQRAPSGPLALGGEGTQGPSARELSADHGLKTETGSERERPSASSFDGEIPPQGAYRPYSTLARQPFAAPTAKPSWQAAFSSSLTAASQAPPSAYSALPPSQSPNTLQFPSFPPLPSVPPPVPTIDLAEKTQESPDSASSPQRSLVRPTASLKKRRALPAGTVLNAILLTAVSTGMPGDAVAHVTSDIMAVDGSVLLPRGARLLGSYKTASLWEKTGSPSPGTASSSTAARTTSQVSPRPRRTAPRVSRATSTTIRPLSSAGLHCCRSSVPEPSWGSRRRAAWGPRSALASSSRGPSRSSSPKPPTST